MELTGLIGNWRLLGGRDPLLFSDGNFDECVSRRKKLILTDVADRLILTEEKTDLSVDKKLKWRALGRVWRIG
ncbi:hypothetical protein PHJA_000856800 [Phtheirospermum japonicum]|uniref:Uncharacterized protein n=1 Tax=Phtheirospermum japonicum TaxID=374723 RepID=A0A830BYM0_9LAMI|nr:hypothetical protein PHJA_000856800 [Phtheirospermum japonicum]